MEFIRSPEISENIRVSELIEMLNSTAFNARKLSKAAKICEDMIKNNAFTFLTLAGAMIPAGMRRIISGMIERRFVSALVVTGANVVHEIGEALGYRHIIGSQLADDVELSRKNLNRIYDVLIEQRAFEGIEQFLSEIIQELEGDYATYEFLWEVGKRIEDEKSFLKLAYEKNVPVFCPTLHDSIAGLHLFIYRKKLTIDVLKDVSKIVDLCFQKRKMGVIIIGGGVPKNFTLQAMLLAEGFDYAVQITTDSPHFGGLSGATLEEAKSWCKLKPDAKAVTVYCDATIALPLIYAYLVDKIR